MAVTPDQDATAAAPTDGGRGSSLSADEFSATVSAITSAFGDPTRRDIYLHLRDLDEGATAAEIAKRFDLHANVARHHLDKLAAAGHVEVTLGRPGGGAGRPSKRYLARVTDELDLAVRRDDLIGSLLGRALAALPPAEAERIAEEVGEDYGASLAHSIEPGSAHRSFTAAAGTVAAALTSHGFAARAESAADGLRIVSEHCPFGDAALEHPVLCAIDRGLVRGMLAGLAGVTGDATLSASRARGDVHCVTDLDPAAPT